MTTAQAKRITGGLSYPSKMPCASYNLPAQRCQVGAKLRALANSTCSVCYAYDRGRYVFPSVKKALERRWQALTHPNWTYAMSVLIQNENNPHFRWHDSGDIQSLTHLERIVSVAVLTPQVQHWLPTREYKYIKDFLKVYKTFPKNLNVRVSTPMIDPSPGALRTFEAGFPTISSVVTSGASCPAHAQGNHCGACRACWDPSVSHVSYPKH